MLSKLQRSEVSFSTPGFKNPLLHERAIIVFYLIISIHFISLRDLNAHFLLLFPNILCTVFFPFFHFKGRELRGGWYAEMKNQFPKKQ